jgi:hypothetical protein
MMLNHLFESVRLKNGTAMPISGGAGEHLAVATDAAGCLTEFRLEAGLPVWRYEVGRSVIEKRILLPYRQNTVHISYHMISGEEPIRLEIRPSVNFRSHDAPVSKPPSSPYSLSITDNHYEIAEPDNPCLPPLRMLSAGRGRTGNAITDGGTRRRSQWA